MLNVRLFQLKCSGLAVRNCDESMLAEELGYGFRLAQAFPYRYVMPSLRAQIQGSLPDGVAIEPFLDRSALISGTTDTVYLIAEMKKREAEHSH